MTRQTNAMIDLVVELANHVSHLTREISGMHSEARVRDFDAVNRDLARLIDRVDVLLTDEGFTPQTGDEILAQLRGEVQGDVPVRVSVRVQDPGLDVGRFLALERRLKNPALDDPNAVKTDRIDKLTARISALEKKQAEQTVSLEKAKPGLGLGYADIEARVLALERKHDQASGSAADVEARVLALERRLMNPSLNDPSAMKLDRIDLLAARVTTLEDRRSTRAAPDALVSVVVDLARLVAFLTREAWGVAGTCRRDSDVARDLEGLVGRVEVLLRDEGYVAETRRGVARDLRGEAPADVPVRVSVRVRDAPADLAEATDRSWKGL